jgi:phosphoribosyl-ATP pyrophosphohydrolase
MKLKLMILDRNINTTETNENDSWEEISNKLKEEHIEAQEAILQGDRLHIAEELLDTIQVAIRGLILLAKEGFDISKLFSRHNKKLVNRGWKEKKIINIFIK